MNISKEAEKIREKLKKNNSITVNKERKMSIAEEAAILRKV